MAEFYKGNNRKMMTHDSFSTSHEDISYMEKLPAIPNSVSYDGETKPKVSAVGRNQQFPQSNSANSAIGKKLSIVNCTLLIVFCLLFGGNAWGQSYPTVSFGSGCEPICRVVFNTIDKSSGCTTSADKYEDFTSTTTTVVAGNSYSITVYGNTDGNYTNYIKVFFDFNRDYDFDDSGESFDIGTISNCSSCSVSGTITIPSSETSGNVRMRVVKNYGSYGTSSGGGFGQAEDYTVVVQPLQPPASVPYSCNFENTTENGNWRFGNATDGWYIGSATYNSSSKSLYVSANGGTSNSYNSTYQYIYAYRNLNFNSIGDFVVSYKWKALGETCCDYMRAFLVPASINPTLAPGSSNGIGQTGAPTGWIAVDGGNKLNGQSSWQNGSSVASISATGTYYLVFYWYSDQSNQGGSYNPPAAVDDIQVNAVEPASVPYSNDFENSTENSRWFFRNSSDGWYIGSATCSSSSKSLYVSADGGSSNSYNNTYQYIYAYRTLNFSSTGTYNVSYNWKALAETCCDYLRGFLVPATSNPNLVAGQSNGIGQTGAPSGWMAIDGGNKLNGQSSWQVYSGNVTISTAGTYYLVFYWYSDQSNQGGSYNPPAAVDNIEITPYAAEITSINCNTTNWCIGETRTVTLQVKNTGSVTWKTSATGGNTECSTMNNIVAVSYKWDEDEWYDSHPNSRIEFSANVAPNGTATITFDVDGPRKSGTNHLSFNVIRRECKWLNPTGTTSVEVTVPALSLTASPTTLCDGGESVLSMSCGQTADFYEYEPYIWDWSSNSYYSSGNQPTHIGSPVIERSIIKFTTAGNDPSIDMYNIGSYNPSIYKYVRMRYRVTGGNAGSVQIFYQSTTGNNSGGAHGDYYKNGTLTSDNQWHIVEIDMSTHPLWTSNGNIKGWRLDPCTASGVTMEIDWIGLFPDPIATGESMLSVSPSQNTTYSACNYMVNRSCIHKATKAITVATSPTITSSPDIAATCFNSARQVTLTASGGVPVLQSGSFSDGFESGLGNWTVTNSTNWEWKKGTGSGHSSGQTSAHVGSYNANIQYNSHGNTSSYLRLNTDLSSYTNIKLSFWYCNPSWSGDIDFLYVEYSSDGTSYTNLSGYTGDHSSWTQVSNLTIPNGTKYIRFRAYGDYGYGVGVDDVSLTYSYPAAPTYSWSSTGTAGSASGATYTVTPRAGSNTYTVSASGCSRTVSIDVLTADNITASGATTDCGTPVTLTASGIDGATYNWYSDAACNTIVASNCSSYTPQNITSSQTYYVKATEDYLGGDLYEYAVRDFGYTGSVQEFVIPEGTEALKLEVWGAQGGNADSRFTGGYGGYSYGTYSVSRGKLYIAVGGQGTTDNGSYSSSTSLAGGWNGGGAGRAWTGTSHSGAGGGGATHIATATGVLSGLSSNRGAVLIVAGGGGGASDNGNGGNGGGTSGAAGNGTGGCAAGTQTSGSAWGYATNCTYTDGECGGGGGGWYGGYSATAENYAGGGGSGYLNPVLTSSSTTAGQRSGNGYARITIYKRSPIPCTSSAKSVALTVNPLPTPTVTSNSPICEGSQAQLQIQSPNNAYTYSWYSGSTNVANATSYSPTLNNDASYTVNANSTHDQIIATYDFDYTGEMQEVVAPANTSYAILEVWGAEGGRSRGNGNWMGNGGKGGYSKGKFATSSGQHFYVVVGGKGHDAVLGTGNIVISAIGGYNGGGGGNCDDDNEVGGEASGAGGGATHIAKAAPSGSTNYQLRNYSSNRNDVLIVAGGGGGASWDLNGGAGGGETGGSGTTTGTIIYGGFGYGANAVGMGRDDGVAGGGGGWQGGNACSASSGGSNAGGGSGYIGGVTEGTTTGGVQSGNGHARIVFYRNGGGSCVSADRSVSVVVNTAPTAPTSISGTTPICSGSSTTLTAAGGSTGSGATYQWGTGTTVGSNIISGNGASVTVSPNANTTYWVRRVGNSACTNTTGGATQLITVNTAPTAPTSISGTSTICNGSSTTLTAAGGSTGSGATYQWGTGTTVGSNIISGNGASVTVSPNANTTYWVRRVGNSACTNTTGGATQLITVNTAPTAPTSISGTSTICNGSSTTLTAAGGSTGSGATYQWGTGTTVGSNTISGSGASVTVSPNANTTYWVRRIGNSACTNTTGGATQLITVNTAPTAPTSISGTSTICSGSSTTLTAAGGSTGSGATYQWGTGTTVGSNIISGSGASVTVSPNANTTYWVRRIGNSACTNTTGGATQLITVNTAPTAPTSISGSNICLGNNTELSVLGGSEGDGSTYQWGTGTTVGENTISGNTSTITVTPTETTTYWVRRVGNTACVNNTDGVTKQITVNTPNPSASGTYDYIWRGGSTDWNTASNWYMYSGGNYSVASSIPATAKNYYIGTGDCLPSGQWPSLSANATVGNVTIAGGSVTIPANKTLSIAGSINGTLTAQDNSTIAFVGSDDQTLSDAATFDNITIAQTATGKKIIAPNGITVNGLATFGTGVLSGDVSFAGSASATGASLTSYIDGTVTKTLGSAAFTFPLGSNGVLGEVYVPATRSGGTVSMHFNKSASADGFDVENDGYPRFWNINDMCAEDGANRFHHVSNAEYWDISSTAVVSGVNFRSIATSDIHFNDTSINQRDVEAIKFAIYDGCWKNMGGTATVSGDYYELSINGVTIPATNRSGLKGSFGSTDDETLLPIELFSFSATCDGRSALIEWTTATEKNNDYFSLERSDDAINFTEIARVAGAGNSIEPLDYAYTDYGIHGGDNYYRLVQVDYDGTRTVSEIVVANCIEPEVGEPDVQAYPNPFNDELTVVLDNFGNRAATIEVYDMLGKLIYTNKVTAPQNSYETILNLSNLPPAAYTVRVSTNDFVINKNVVKN